MKPMLHLLPVEAYTSQDWFDREMREIFSKTWRYAGFMEDVSEPGQYIAVQAGLNNIFVIMGRDRRLRAFHNICRHRGMILVSEPRKIEGAIRCPYHSWCYSTKGKLVSTPVESIEFGQRAVEIVAVETQVDVDAIVRLAKVWRTLAEETTGPERVEALALADVGVES